MLEGKVRQFGPEWMECGTALLTVGHFRELLALLDTAKPCHRFTLNKFDNLKCD